MRAVLGAIALGAGIVIPTSGHPLAPLGAALAIVVMVVVTAPSRRDWKETEL